MNILASINESTVLAPAIILIVAFILLTIVIIAAAIYLISRYHTYINNDTLVLGRNEKEGKKLKTWQGFLIVLGIGLLIRLLLTFFVKGFYASFENEYSIVDHLVRNGFAGLYSNSSNDLTNSSPLLMYIYFITAGLGKSMGVELNDVSMSFFVKLPYLIADVIIAVGIYRIASKHLNRYMGLILSGFFLLCPVFFVASSMWGTPYAIYAALLFFAFYYLLKRNIPLMTAFVTLSLLLIPESLYILPLFLAYMIYLFVKAIIQIVKSKPTFDGAMGDSVMKSVVDIPVCIIISVCAIYLIALPAYFADFGPSFFEVYGQLFIKPIESINYYSANSLNIFVVFGQNYHGLGNEFPKLIFALLFIALIVVVVLVVFLSNKNRANLVLLGSYLLITLSTYYIGMTEWTILAALLLMILAFIVIKDKRILKVFSVFAVISLLNVLLVMLYSNNISMTVDKISESGLTFTNAPAGFVFSIILSVFAVITHIYYTVIMLDISMAKRRIMFTEDNLGLSFSESMGAWLKNRR